MATEPQEKSPLQDIRDTLGKMGAQFKAVLPSQEHVDRFIRVVMTAVQGNVDLLECDRGSFYSACMKCAQDGLMPDGKEAVLKIYNTKVDNSWKKMAAYEPMADGLMKKLRLSGEIIGAPKVHVVYQNDDFKYLLGDEEKIIHLPPQLGQARGDIVGAYSIVKLKSGDTSREVMDILQIDDIMNRTKSKDKDGKVFGPWKTDKAEMCRKTVFKRHYKRLPRSSDLDNIINRDNEENGLVDIPQASQAASAAAAPPAGASAGQRRPAALEAVASAGGTPVPEQKATERREPVTIEQEANKPAATSEAGKPPQDII